MLVNNILPYSVKTSGIKSLLSNHDMLAFFKKFCNAILSRSWKFKRARNARYEDQDFLKVFFLSEILGRSIHDTSELLNDYLMGFKKGRRKLFSDGRKRRIVPHQTEVNKYLRKIGLNRARTILRTCLDSQLMDALSLGLILKKVNVIVDFTEHAYYGKREDIMIKGTNRQKGTRKMRHYLGFSILSKNIHLYAGLEHVANGQSKIPIILEFLEHLLDLGFELNYVLMDREFYRAVLLHEIKARKGNTLIPTKQYRKVRGMIEAYIKGEGNRVRKYTFSTANEAKRRFFQQVYLIIKAKRGFTLQGVKRAYRLGRISLDDARKQIFAIMTTEKPKGKTSSWASRTSLFYRRRWLIETGFSDLNRINRRWKSNYDNVRYLDMLARLLLYNSWKMNNKVMNTARMQERKGKKWTLVQYQNYLKQLFLIREKKLLGVMG
jgi:hypothetical protein